MIASSHRRPSGGKEDVIWTKAYYCMVSTTKEGFFQRPSTAVREIRGKDGYSDSRHLVEFIYQVDLPKSDRLRQHDAIVAILDRAGENEGISLEDALNIAQTHLYSENVIERSVWVN